MVRVAKPEAIVLLLVPNSGFLTQRLGLYSGTQQASVCEEVRSLPGWHQLFGSVGLHICQRWRDLHVLSLSWICRGPWYGWPLRASQALVLPLWPLTWQYQAYHLCVVKRSRSRMSILVVTWNYPPRGGGIEYLVSKLCAGLRQRHSLIVVTSHAPTPYR